MVLQFLVMLSVVFIKSEGHSHFYFFLIVFKCILNATFNKICNNFIIDEVA